MKENVKKIGVSKKNIPDTIIGAAGMLAAMQFQKQMADALAQAIREKKNVDIRIRFVPQIEVGKHGKI